MPTNVESGKDYLTRVIAALPEDRRAQVQALLLDEAAAAALDVAGQGAKRQDDYSREMDALRAREARANAELQQAQTLAAQARTVEAQQVEWWNQNRAALEEAERQRAAGGTPTPTPTTTPTAPAPSTMVSREYFDATAGEFLGVIGWATTQAAKHSQTFGEVLDVPSLITEARQKKVTLQEAYDDKFRPRYEERAAKALADREAALRREGAEEFQRLHPNIPYPVPSSAGGDTLAGLKPAEGAQYGPDAAAAEYTRLVAARGAVQ